MTTPDLCRHAQQPGDEAEAVAAAVARQQATLRPYVELHDLWARTGGRRSTTIEDYWKILAAFASFAQRKELRRLRRKDVIGFRDTLLGDGQSATTVRRKIGVLKTLFRVAMDYELLASNPADSVRVSSARRGKARVAFTVEELNRLLASPIYTENYRPRGAGREAAFWLPLLALHTGARVEELAQLLAADVVHEEGLGHYLNITDEAEHAKLKNASSRRRIPVHATLLDCGFLDYVDSVRHRRFLFPDLKANPRGKLGGYFSTFFSRYLRRQVGIADGRKVFHSFRHGFKDICRAVGIDEAVHDALTGHTAPGAGRKYGNEQYPLPPLFEAMERFRIEGLEIDRLYTRPPTSRLRQGTPQQLISAYYGVVIALSQVKSIKPVPPYLFARCQGGEAAISITDNTIIHGDLPAPKRHLVHAWVEIHREELIANWEIGLQTGEFFRIDPLR